MNIRKIESLGTITKKEKIALVEHETNCNYLILESLSPFPGYHGTTVPDKLEPDSLFAITKMKYNEERIIRSIQAVKKRTKIHFDAAPGSVDIQHQPHNLIRFKYINYGKIGEILMLFTEEGIGFKRRKKLAHFEALLKVRKFFHLVEKSEGIFQDQQVKFMSYIQMPLLLTWKTFEKITTNIKYNMKDKNFDAALTSIYTSEGMSDFVRIYTKEDNHGKLLRIQQKYMEAISRL